MLSGHTAPNTLIGKRLKRSPQSDFRYSQSKTKVGHWFNIFLLNDLIWNRHKKYFVKCFHKHLNTSYRSRRLSSITDVTFNLNYFSHIHFNIHLLRFERDTLTLRCDIHRLFKIDGARRREHTGCTQPWCWQSKATMSDPSCYPDPLDINHKENTCTQCQLIIIA